VILGIGLMAEEKRKRGRPPKAPSERKRGNVTIRIRDRLYEKVTEEAAKGQRSLSEEIERGLEAYYEQREAYGELARFVGTAVRTIETAAGKAWFADDEMRLKTRGAIEAVLDLLVCERIDQLEVAKASDAVVSWMTFRLKGQEVWPPGKPVPEEPDIEHVGMILRRGVLWLEAHMETLKGLQTELKNMPPQALAHLGVRDEEVVPAKEASNPVAGSK
jgi:hypothetical protein